MIDIAGRPSSAQLRWFGLSLATLLGLLALVAWRRAAEQLALLLLCSAAATVGAYYLFPGTRILIIRAFRILVLPLHIIVSLTLIAVLYYLIVTPIGWTLRLWGRDPLEKFPDPHASTYWRPATTDRPPNTYFRQY